VSRDLELGGVPAVSPSTSFFSDFNDIWYVGKRSITDARRYAYDPLQGQGQGHECLKAA